MDMIMDMDFLEKFRPFYIFYLANLIVCIIGCTVSLFLEYLSKQPQKAPKETVKPSKKRNAIVHTVMAALFGLIAPITLSHLFGSIFGNTDIGRYTPGVLTSVYALACLKVYWVTTMEKPGMMKWWKWLILFVVYTCVFFFAGYMYRMG